MLKIDKPDEVASEVFLACIGIVKNVNLKNRLAACEETITEACTEFEDRVGTGQLHTVIREGMINGNVTSKELEDVYTLRMARKNKPGRPLYDKILISAPHGICPLCGLREATTLDHYLPKADYPRLAVVPINLVPACKDCNTLKLTSYPTDEFEEPIHPYFDDIENIDWLKAIVLQSTPPAIKFYTNPPEECDDLLIARIKYHFESLSLNKLYSTHAASELRQINFSLNNHFNRSGADGVRTYLLEAAETRSHDNINSWQAAMYMATADNEWFCNGGFRLAVPP
jgi:5-methylcytosine-specific restriction endonuclease McrA